MNSETGSDPLEGNFTLGGSLLSSVGATSTFWKGSSFNEFDSLFATFYLHTSLCLWSCTD